MKIRYSIVSVIVLSGLLSLQAYAVPVGVSNYVDAEIHSVDDQPYDPYAHSLLFSIHHQSESTIHSFPSNSLNSTEDLSEEDIFGSKVSERFRNWLFSSYISVLGIKDVSQTIKDLIFPFHTHF